MRLTDQQAAEIDTARAQRSETARPTVAALEAMLFEAIPVLDHGFVRVIDYMGDDAAIVQAARVSYGRGTRRVSEDMVVAPGDTVWVDRAPQVYMYGEIQHPGALRLERGMTLMQAVAASGGATRRRATLTRPISR